MAVVMEAALDGTANPNPAVSKQAGGVVGTKRPKRALPMDADRLLFRAIGRGDYTGAIGVFAEHPEGGIPSLECGVQALTQGSEEEGWKFLELLFERGLDPNHILVDRQSRPTLVHLAAEIGIQASLETVLRYGGSVAARDRQGRWPVHVAVEHAQIGSIAVLLQHERETTGSNASLNAKDRLHYTPIMWTAESGSVAAARILVEYGGEADAVDAQGHSTLHWASERGHGELVRYLCEAGCEIDRVGLTSLQTPLHWACLGGMADSVYPLLEAGASVDCRDAKGSTAWDVCEERSACQEAMLALRPWIAAGMDLDDTPPEGGNTQQPRQQSPQATIPSRASPNAKRKAKQAAAASSSREPAQK